jgi:hypothetical protein
MGKLFTVILISLFALVTNAQDSLCVFKIKGVALAKFEKAKKPIKKGDILNEKNTVYLSSTSNLTLINSEGKVFNLESSGAYNYSDVLKNEYVENQKGLTSRYFKMIWKDLTNKDAGKTIIGGVYRGDVLMEFPLDSASIASSKIKLTWTTDENISQYYVFIRDGSSDEVHKFATNGNELTLYKDNPVFSDSKSFEWAVSTKEFPNLKNIPFYSFTLINRSEYESLKSRYDDFISDLETIGLSSIEIEETLCNTYGICK